MKITRENYEVFFLDYLDGNLDEQNMDQFLDFLEQNADLKEELRSLEQVRLPEEITAMSGKERLYKTAEEEKVALGNKFVAYLEGDLEEEDRERFESFLTATPGLQKEYALFEKTRLKPDQNIQFTNKQKLYRKPTRVIVMNWLARVAAVVVLIWGISSLFRSQQSPVDLPATPEIAQVAPKTETPKEKITSDAPPEKPEIQEQKMTEIAQKVESIKPVAKKIISKKLQEIKTEPVVLERENIAMAQIQPLGAQLQEQQPDAHLAFSKVTRFHGEQKSPKEIGVPEFLAERAKRVENGGARSFQRLARFGLGLASEISGDRISYSEKNGKIASVGFESKLMAFTIPLKKK